MFDIFSVLADQNARETAEWYPITGDFDTAKKIKVQNLSESRKHYSVISENLDTSRADVYLRTRFNYDYRPEQHIKYRNRWYEITEVQPRELGSYGYERYKEYVLVLLGVNYGLDFEDTAGDTSED